MIGFINFQNLHLLCFQPFKCEDFVLFLVTYDIILNVFGIWTFCQIKQAILEDTNLGSVKL